MLIESEVLETICKNTIETILFCLENATKGTIYRVGCLPELRTVRVTSGVWEEGGQRIKWGLPGFSDYNEPGKSWSQYCDMPGRALEAMGWCVEKQTSWTSDNPFENPRSVKKQLHGEIEECNHMEPVLVSKKDLYGEKRLHGLEYPPDCHGNPIWQEMDYVVVAVIKIHFLPFTVARGDRATRVIKMLSRALGTEMLSLYLREGLLHDQRELARQRLESCNVLAHELRNTLVKLCFAFSAINAEIGFLREQWEVELRKAFPQLPDKKKILEHLSEFIRLGLPRMDEAGDEKASLARHLLAEQEELLGLFLLPRQEEVWINERLEPKWEGLLLDSLAWHGESEKIRKLLASLKKAVWIGVDRELAEKLVHIPEELRKKWPELAYTRFSADKISLLDDIIDFLDNPLLPIAHKQHSRKVFTSLQALVRIIPEIEKRTNTVISCLKGGISNDESAAEVELCRLTPESEAVAACSS